MLVNLSGFSNASNLVICNSTYKPASKFFNDCLSVKSVRKLIDVSRKRHCKQFIHKKNSRQRGFRKPVTAVSTLMMSIYFYELGLLFFIFRHNFCNDNVDIFFKHYLKCDSFSTDEFLTSNSFTYREPYSVTIFNIPQ